MKKAQFTCKTSFRKTKQSTTGRTPFQICFSCSLTFLWRRNNPRSRDNEGVQAGEGGVRRV